MHACLMLVRAHGDFCSALDLVVRCVLHDALLKRFVDGNLQEVDAAVLAHAVVLSGVFLGAVEAQALGTALVHLFCRESAEVSAWCG
jgi:hypothetical protein